MKPFIVAALWLLPSIAAAQAFYPPNVTLTCTSSDKARGATIIKLTPFSKGCEYGEGTVGDDHRRVCFNVDMKQRDSEYTNYMSLTTRCDEWLHGEKHSLACSGAIPGYSYSIFVSSEAKYVSAFLFPSTARPPIGSASPDNGECFMD